ncbi:unnamed protein product, partial [Rotaria sp. Silwood1]
MIDQKLLISLSIVLLLTFYDLNRSYVYQNPISINNDISSIPTPKMKMQMAPIIKFRYCHSCGYQNLFKQFSELVH